jgi:hypothetical protein
MKILLIFSSSSEKLNMVDKMFPHNESYKFEEEPSHIIFVFKIRKNHLSKVELKEISDNQVVIIQ